ARAAKASAVPLRSESVAGCTCRLPRSIAEPRPIAPAAAPTTSARNAAISRIRRRPRTLADLVRSGIRRPPLGPVMSEDVDGGVARGVASTDGGRPGHQAQVELRPVAVLDGRDEIRRAALDPDLDDVVIPGRARRLARRAVVLLLVRDDVRGEANSARAGGRTIRPHALQRGVVAHEHVLAR